MHFFNWANAASFVEDFSPKLNAGKARCFVRGKAEPIPWRCVTASGVDNWWTRFCITKEVVGGIDHYVVRAITWPDGAIKDHALQPVIEDVDRIEESVL